MDKPFKTDSRPRKDFRNTNLALAFLILLIILVLAVLYFVVYPA